MADSKRFCAGCMTKMNGTHCTQCAWDDSVQGEVHAHLPRHFILLDRYYIGKVLGQGGFGVTYLARDIRLDRAVAIKEYLPMEQCARLTNRITVQPHTGEREEQFTYGKEGFLNEARALARLEGHPNIVSITDFAEANGTAYLVMAYIDGVSLKQYLVSKGGRLPYQVAIDLMMHVMSAVREMHSHGLLHRDISPGNIMITRQSQVKVVDFGAARYAIGEQSKSLSMILKPGYAPEEQYRTKGKQGAWTDVYAIGATLYHCLTGVIPSPSPDRMAEDDLVRPSLLCPDIPSVVDDAIMKAVAVRAADRFSTIEAFQNALIGAGGKASGFDATPAQHPESPDVLQVETNNAESTAPGKDSGTRGKGIAILRIVLACFLLLPFAIWGISMLHQGSTPPSSSDSLDRLQEKADAGDHNAEIALGNKWHYGNGVAEDDWQAAKWYEKAAESGDSTATSLLADLYRSGGPNLPQDYSKAITWYEKLGTPNSTAFDTAAVQVGDLYAGGGPNLQKDYSLAIESYEKAARDPSLSPDTAGNIDFSIGKLYREGGFGLKQSFGVSRDWFEKCIRLGNDTWSPVCMDWLGETYLEGGHGVRQDSQLALQWFEKAAANGNNDAMFNLGLMFTKPAPHIEKNFVTAKGWFQQAVAKGNTDAMDWLGWLEKEGGDGIPIDENAARDLLEKSAAANNAEGMVDLGDLYSHYEHPNSSIPLDVARSRQLYEKAAGLGSKNAKLRLKNSCVVDNSCK